MKSVKVPVYVTSDGRKFKDYILANNHAEKINSELSVFQEDKFQSDLDQRIFDSADEVNTHNDSLSEAIMYMEDDMGESDYDYDDGYNEDDGDY